MNQLGDAPGRVFAGMTVYESDLVPYGTVLHVGWGNDLHVNPYNAYGEREGWYAFKTLPFWTRHCVGVREAARDRRLRRTR